MPVFIDQGIRFVEASSPAIDQRRQGAYPYRDTFCFRKYASRQARMGTGRMNSLPDLSVHRVNRCVPPPHRFYPGSGGQRRPAAHGAATRTPSWPSPGAPDHDEFHPQHPPDAARFIVARVAPSGNRVALWSRRRPVPAPARFAARSTASRCPPPPARARPRTSRCERSSPR